MVYPCIHMYGALWRHNGNIFMVKSRKINNTDLGRAVGEGGGEPRCVCSHWTAKLARHGCLSFDEAVATQLYLAGELNSWTIASECESSFWATMVGIYLVDKALTLALLPSRTPLMLPTMLCNHHFLFAIQATLAILALLNQYLANFVFTGKVFFGLKGLFLSENDYTKMFF